MSRQSTLQHVLVGALFLGSLAIIGIATLTLQGLPWKQAGEVAVRFQSIDNLREGEPVLIFGHRVGQVESLKLETKGSGKYSIVVRCRLEEAIQLTDKTQFFVRSSGPLGGRFVEIVPQPGNNVALSWDQFQGQADGDLFRQVERFLGRHGDNLDGIVESLDASLTSLRHVMTEVESGRGTLGMLIQDPVLAADVAGFVANMNSIATRLEQGEGTLGAILRDDALRERVTSTVYDLSDVVRNVKEGEGVVGMLISDTTAREDARSILRELQQTAVDINHGDGVVARLLNNRELAMTVDEAVVDVHELVHKVNAGEGTLGQAVNSREAWDQFLEILTQALEGLEDLREQAPINTFANVLFSVF